MRRDRVKGAALFACGWFPGGAWLYRNLTRNFLGTQATHVDKLSRVWPGYVDVWRSRCGMCLEGKDIWVHEGGWTPYPHFVNYLLTGSGGIVTNSEGHPLDRYLSRAVEGALATALPLELVPNERRERLEALREQTGVQDAIREVKGVSLTDCISESLPLEDNSIDLCHSGGALEHYGPARLDAFLRECCRILRPGGIASHVLDHRDHLHHADKRRPFLAHLGVPEALYLPLYGHPLLYHNRLLPGQVMQAFAAAGFEPIALRRMIYPKRVYEEGKAVLEGDPGIARTRLARQFHNADEADLRTAAAHYLFRKPIG